MTATASDAPTLAATRALEQAVALSAELRDLNGRRTTLGARRRECWRRAREGGISEAEIAAACGVNPSLVRRRPAS